MRLATYNIEWFTHLFNEENELLLDNAWSARRDVTRKEQADSIAFVIETIDPDGILIVEAPNNSKKKSTIKSLENFAHHYGLRQIKAKIGFSSKTQQEIAFLFDPDILSVEHDPLGDINTPDSISPRFDQTYLLDIDTDQEPEQHVFSKPPLELKIETNLGSKLRLIGVHIKSKAPFGAKNKNDEIRISIENRRKQLAQSLWLRSRIDTHLSNNEKLIVLGDFNDGPGLDEFEKLFGKSSIEILLGQHLEPAMQMYSPYINSHSVGDDEYSTARFFDHKNKIYLNLLLDFIFVPRLCEKITVQSWNIWNPFRTSAFTESDAVKRALLSASDHFPVSLDLDL